MAIVFPAGAVPAPLENGPQNGPYTLAWAGGGKWADRSLWKWHLRRDGVTVCGPHIHQDAFLPQHYWIVAEKLPVGANMCRRCEPALGAHVAK
jgi:hypothetical protein